MRRTDARMCCSRSTWKVPAAFCLSIMFGLAAASAHGQETNSLPGPWLSFSVGAALPAGGATQVTTGNGGTMLLGFGSQPRGRLSWSGSMILSLSGLPKAILNQGHEPDGSAASLAFDFDPAYFLRSTPRFNLWIIGGGGISLKDVEFDNPSFSCGDEDNDCIVSSKTTWQPATDGGIGFAWRIHDGGALEFIQEDRITHLFTPQNAYPGFNTAGTTIVSVTLGVRLDMRRGR